VNTLTRRLLRASLQRRSPRWRLASWAAAVGGPVLIAVALAPVRSSIGLSSVLFFTLLLVVATAAIGGMWPGLTAALIGFGAGDFFFTPPYHNLGIRPSTDWVALSAFLVVGAIVGTATGALIDQLAGLANEQAALRQVATFVARAAPPDELLAAVSRVVGDLLAVDYTTMYRYVGDASVTVVANWDKTGRQETLGTRYPLGGDDVSTLVARTGEPARIAAYRPKSDPRLTGAADTAARSEVGTPITVERRPWGVLVVGSTRKPLPPETESRLADFTDLVATAIANADSRDEIAASRARVVASADEARRRIERDLHDGVQQRLMSLGLELRLAQRMVPAESPELNAQLAVAAKSVGDIGDELRQISRGVHPDILSKGGIGAAIKMLARRCPIPVELAVPAGPQMPEWLEVAIYYVVSEALTNAAKHSRASRVQVGFEVVDAVLHLSVRDDGVGGADPAVGSGLIGLRDRVEAFGGTIEVASTPGAGTHLHVALPIERRTAPPAHGSPARATADI
jgi:signal transduction histidine kinase